MMDHRYPEEVRQEFAARALRNMGCAGCGQRYVRLPDGRTEGKRHMCRHPSGFGRFDVTPFVLRHERPWLCPEMY